MFRQLGEGFVHRTCTQKEKCGGMIARQEKSYRKAYSGTWPIYVKLELAMGFEPATC
jgi:hypothetical protein